jgi:DNA-binding MarR family transcriptional regulator/N-acetylglutamate synthase-like GNAT family acetyltransferase
MDEVAQVRSFNRLVTRQVGALQDRYLGERPLGELRVLFEIGSAGATPRDVRIRLGLDSGYVSRMISTLERDGLLERHANPADRRTTLLKQTAAGTAQMGRLNAISDEMARAVLDPLTPEQRQRLLAAQAEVARLLAVSMVKIEPADPHSADARWCLEHYFAELAERFEEGFEPGRTLPADRPDVFVIARIDGQPAGCGALQGHEILRMWVDHPHRGLGVAGRILTALETEAAARGHEVVRLYTNRALAEAQTMYRKRGYVEVERFNDDPYANHFFEKRL